MTYSQTIESIQTLREQVRGDVFTPDSADYETTRRGFNLLIDHHPALILVADDAQDIVAAVNYARQQGLGIAVQLTGHGIQHPADDALLIVPSRMTAVTVDADAHTARAEAGALWQHVLDAATPYGLAPLMGTAPRVGVVGYTLGGGLGWLARRYGLAVDAVRSVDIVTPDGVLRRANADENSDLFWAVRGGGGNFGVVTAIEFDLYPVSKVYGGSLIYPGEAALDVLRFFRDWVKNVPDELTSMLGIIKFPNIPQLPEHLRGQTMVNVRAAYAGPAESGAALIQPWLDWRAPTSNLFREMPFSEIGVITNDPTTPTASYASSEMFDSLSDEALEIIARAITDPQTPLLFVDLRHALGAVARVDASKSAVGNREATFYFQIAGLAMTPPMRDAVRAYITHVGSELRPYARGGVYQNFMAGAEANYRAKDAYGAANLDRLIALKAKYDPDNQFRYSYQLVTPNSAGA